MSSYIYLIRNGNLFKIGSIKNLDLIKIKFKPDEIICSLKVKKPKVFVARLHRRYKLKRVKGSDYFRLSQGQLRDCKRQISEKTDIPQSISLEFSVGLTFSILLCFLFLALFIYLNFNILRSSSYSIAIGSLPIWFILIKGNFGGFDSDELPLFSLMINRLKALVAIISLSSIAYVLYQLSPN